MVPFSKVPYFYCTFYIKLNINLKYCYIYLKFFLVLGKIKGKWGEGFPFRGWALLGLLGCNIRCFIATTATTKTHPCSTGATVVLPSFLPAIPPTLTPVRPRARFCGFHGWRTEQGRGLELGFLNPGLLVQRKLFAS